MNRLKNINALKGFTLLELLVALVLIGIILSFATLSFDSGEDRKIKEEAKRIFSLIKLAQEESILNDRILSLNINNEGYQFTLHRLNDENKYEEVRLEDPVFRPRNFAEYIHPIIKIENNQFNLQSDKKKKQAEEIKIYFLSSGELTPFQIEFPATGVSYEISGSLQGVVELLTHNRDS